MLKVKVYLQACFWRILQCNTWSVHVGFLGSSILRPLLLVLVSLMHFSSSLLMQIPCSEKKLCEKNRQRARKKKTHFRVTLKETTKEDQTFYLVKTKLRVFSFLFSSWRYISFVCIRWLFATYCCMEFLCKTCKITLLKMSRESYSLEWKEWHSRKVKRRATLKKLFFCFYLW